MIRVVDVSHHYGIRPVLSHVDFHVPAGQLVAVMGPNGVGKSTLLGTIAGIISPAKGYVEIDGLRRRSSEEAELSIRRCIAFLPDHPWLPEALTTREWLFAVGQLYDVDSEVLLDHIDRLLGVFDLTEKDDAPIRSCSNGQKKKIAVCGALVTDARVLVLDEPFTGGLDPSAILALRQVLRHLAERREKTIVMATQVPEIVEDMAHRIAILSGTRIIAYDTFEALQSQAGGAGTLPEVFEKLVHPRTLEHVENYFRRPGL